MKNLSLSTPALLYAATLLSGWSYTTTLAAQTSLPPGKLAIEQRYAQERAAGALNPAPKDPNATAPALADLPFDAGVIDDNDAPFPSQNLEIVNRWQGTVNGVETIIYAGGESEQFDPTQGLVVVMTIPKYPGTTGTKTVLSSNKGGALRIVSEQNGVLTLISATGSFVLTFDTGTGKFTSEKVDKNAFFTPSPLNFGTVPVGTESVPIPVTVVNNTGSPVSYLSESYSPSFIVSNGNCMNSLAAGATCTFGVTYLPIATGPASGYLTISTVNGPVTLQGSGTADTGPVYFNPSSFNFGDVPVGTSSAPVTVTLTNNSGANVTTPTTVGTSDLHFVPGTCTGVLISGASCTIKVTFAPTAAVFEGGALEYKTANGVVVFEAGGTGQKKN